MTASATSMRALAEIILSDLRPVPAIAELNVDQLARRDVDVDAAVVGESSRCRCHGGEPLHRRRCHIGVDPAGRPADRCPRLSPGRHRPLKLVGGNCSWCRSGHFLGKEPTRRLFPDEARSPAPAPPAAPPSGASTGRPRPGEFPGGAGSSTRSAQTASPPPPWCTRPRAGPSRGGARDASRDGNAAKMGLPHTVLGCAPAGRGAPARRGVRPRLAWGHVDGDHHPLRGRRGRPGRGRAGLPARPGGRAGHAAQVAADFDRRFGGDALAPPVLEVLDRLGLAVALLAAVPRGTADTFVWRTPTRAYRPGRLPAREREVPVLGPVPQGRFLPFAL